MDEQEAIRQAMSIIGSRRTEKKLDTATENLKKALAAPMTEERRNRIRDAQSARRERERAAKAAEIAANPPAPKERKPMGRPPKPVDPDKPKRGRGRPPKEQATGGSAGATAQG